ncbi:MAG: D-amino-acid transaminase [Sphingobium sp.]
MSVAYLNGQFLPLEQAHVSVLDRGFLFADGIYEVAAVIDGHLVDSAAHLARLERSAGEIGIPLPIPPAEIEAVQKDLVARHGLGEGLVYLQLTRGADDTRDFLPSAAIRPTLVMFVQNKPFLDVPGARDGIGVATMPDLRWKRRDIKSVMLLTQAMAKQAAKAAGAQEAWLVEDGFVTEGASSTAFILTEEGIVTRPYSHAVLAGCTGAALAALAEESGIKVVRRPFTVAEAIGAREAFITSASTFCQSVVRIDGQTIGSGVPGPVAMRLRELYIDFARRTAS